VLSRQTGCTQSLAQRHSDCRHGIGCRAPFGNTEPGLECEHARGGCLRLVDPPAVILASENFGERYEFAFDVRRSLRDDFVKTLAARRLILL